jgi:hypothetical protein
MWKSLQALDRILKGESTRIADLRRGTLDVPLGGLSLVILVLGAFYGVCMGAYAVITRHGETTAAMGYQQLLASAVKVPLLFLLTLVVTFPSLYVFNALVGSRLSLGSLLRLLVAALGVMMALLASFGTIAVFFAVSTDSYAFMVLLNVVLFAVAGSLGLGFLLQTLHRLYNAQIAPPPTATTYAPPAPGEYPAEPAAAPEAAAAAAAGIPRPRRARFDRGAGFQSQRADGVPHLGPGLRARRRADGLGDAAVHRRPVQAVHVLPRARVELLPRRAAEGGRRARRRQPARRPIVAGLTVRPGRVAPP